MQHIENMCILHFHFQESSLKEIKHEEIDVLKQTLLNGTVEISPFNPDLQLGKTIVV